MDKQDEIREQWRMYLEGTHPALTRHRRLYRLLPSDPRCKWCNAPFQGLGGSLMRMIGIQPSNLNPRYCNNCDDFARQHLGGAEVELSMLFADVRGSTTLAEQMNMTEFSRLISRFYAVATDVLIQADALIDKLVGDQVTGFFFPGFTGPRHARAALQAARKLLEATGHRDAGGPWVPVGVGVHTGRAFVGAVGSESGVADVTALGDAVNIAARLSSQAGAGEILVSEDAVQASGMTPDGLEQRQLMLKGRSQPINVRVVRLDAT